MTDRRRQEPDQADGSISTIPSDVCLTLLMGATVGRVAYIGEGGQQELMPVNFAVVHREIYFRTSSTGTSFFVDLPRCSNTGSIDALEHTTVVLPVALG